jgi:hypothetical protein
VRRARCGAADRAGAGHACAVEIRGGLKTDHTRVAPPLIRAAPRACSGTPNTATSWRR